MRKPSQSHKPDHRNLSLLINCTVSRPGSFCQFLIHCSSSVTQQVCRPGCVRVYPCLCSSGMIVVYCMWYSDYENHLQDMQRRFWMWKLLESTDSGQRDKAGLVVLLVMHDICHLGMKRAAEMKCHWHLHYKHNKVLSSSIQYPCKADVHIQNRDWECFVFYCHAC